MTPALALKHDEKQDRVLRPEEGRQPFLELPWSACVPQMNRTEAIP